MDNDLIPSPANSSAAFNTSSLLKIPANVIITSLPVTPDDNFPDNSTLATGGICHQVLPVAQMAAASVRTIGVPKQPKPPYILAWLSEATAIVPGKAYPSSHIIWCPIPRPEG